VKKIRERLAMDVIVPVTDSGVDLLANRVSDGLEHFLLGWKVSVVTAVGHPGLMYYVADPGVEVSIALEDVTGR
jgi:hypothetical protein